MNRIKHLGLQVLQFALQSSLLQPEVVVIIFKRGAFGRKLDRGGVEGESHFLPLLFVFRLLNGRTGNHAWGKSSEKKLTTETKGRGGALRALYRHFI